MNIIIRHIEDIAVIEVEGRININSSKLIEAVGSLLDEGMNKIIIDMQNVEFVDYNGLSVLAIAYKSILNQKGIMKLCGVSLHIIELLRIVKLDEVFEIYNDAKCALDSFKQKNKISKTEVLQQPFRRRFKRLEIDTPVHYRLSRRSSDKEGAQLYSGRMANISGAGIFVRTMYMLPLGSEVDMDVMLEQQKKPKSLKGMVIWIADKSIQPDLYPGMGIAFARLSPHAQEEIIEFIEKNIGHLG